MPKPTLQQQKLTFRSNSISKIDHEIAEKCRSLPAVAHSRDGDSREGIMSMFARQRASAGGEVPLAIPLFPASQSNSDSYAGTQQSTDAAGSFAPESKATKFSPLNLGVVRNSLDAEVRLGTNTPAGGDSKDYSQSLDSESQAPIVGIRLGFMSQDDNTNAGPVNFSGLLGKDDVGAASGRTKALTTDTPIPLARSISGISDAAHFHIGQKKLHRFFNVIPATNNNPFLATKVRQAKRPPPSKAPMPPKHAEISQYLKSFQQIAMIGSGSFCDVYRARSRMDGCAYAVKCRKTALSAARTAVAEDGTLENVSAARAGEVKEVHALAALTSCPFIIRYYNAWCDDDSLYIQTELAWGSLEDAVVGRRPAPSAERIQVRVFQPQFATVEQGVSESPEDSNEGARSSSPPRFDPRKSKTMSRLNAQSMSPSPKMPPPSVRRPLARSRLNLTDDTPTERVRSLQFSQLGDDIARFDERSATPAMQLWSPDHQGVASISLSQVDATEGVSCDGGRRLQRLHSHHPPSIGASQLSQQIAGQKRKVRQLSLTDAFPYSQSMDYDMDKGRLGKVLASPTFNPGATEKEESCGPSPRRRRVCSSGYGLPVSTTPIDDRSQEGHSVSRLDFASGAPARCDSNGDNDYGSQTGFGEEGFSQMSVFSIAPRGNMGGVPVDDPSVRSSACRYHFLEIDLLTVLKHVAAALQYMHARGLAHLDVKPANILITYEGGAAMCDISGEWLPEVTSLGGIPSIDLRVTEHLRTAEARGAKLCVRDLLQLFDEDACSNTADASPAVEVERMRSLGMVRYKLGDLGQVASFGSNDVMEGDSRYLSRELLEGDNTNLAASDIFALGLTLFELASGEPLPTGDEEYHNLREGLLPPEMMPQISPAVQSILRSMVDPGPNRRPTAAQLLSLPIVAALENPDLVCVDNDGHVVLTPSNLPSAIPQVRSPPSGATVATGSDVSISRISDRFPAIAALLGCPSTVSSPSDAGELRMHDMSGHKSVSSEADHSAVFDDSFGMLKTPAASCSRENHCSTVQSDIDFAKTSLFDSVASVVTPLNPNRLSMGGISIQPYTGSVGGANSNLVSPATAGDMANLAVDPTIVSKLRTEIISLLNMVPAPSG